MEEEIKADLQKLLDDMRQRWMLLRLAKVTETDDFVSGYTRGESWALYSASNRLDQIMHKYSMSVDSDEPDDQSNTT